MKFWAAIVIAMLVIVGVTLAAPAADDSCRLKAKEAKDCSLCCAIGGFNKFNATKFSAGNGCACYTDQKELATNERHKPRRP